MTSQGPGDDAGQADQEKPPLRDLPGVAAFATMGSSLAACLAAGVLAGLWADHTWGTAPWCLLIGIVLGTVAAVASVLALVRRYL